MLNKGSDYTESNGVFTFNKLLTDSIYCKMTNAAFRSLISQTVNLDPQGRGFKFTSSKSPISFKIQSSNTSCMIDWGDGKPVSQLISGVQTVTSASTAYSAHKEVKIYDGGISYIELSEQSLTNLDLSNSPALTRLGCATNLLTALDVSNNKLLQQLVCSHN